MDETENISKQPLPSNQKRKKNITKVIILVIIIIIIIAGIIFLPIKDWLIKSLEWTQELGIWGPAFFVACYILACIFFIPGSVLTIGSGFIFKVIKGSITVSIGSTLGACAAFLVGRTIARKWIASKVAKNHKFVAIDEAVAQQGFKIVLLTRLSPVFPFNLLNYAFGLTKISFWKYALASWIGMIPGTIMYVYFGAGLRSLTDVASGKLEKSTAGTIFFWVGLIATIVVTLFVTNVARKALKNAVPQKISETTQMN
jgi:uncharacterized membrane protein YdjX (TVP38/TMEM64 family)